tara:strand:- start:56 stop:769 length:714 start_codon:yes stop_codon:yes gene_type:complete
MKKDNILLYVFKDKGLIIGLFLSLLTHISLIILFLPKEDKLLGDKYIPIEIINIDSKIVKGDSIEKNKQITKRIRPIQEQRIENKRESLFDEKVKEYKQNTLENKENIIEKRSLVQQEAYPENIESENKKRGSKEGTKIEDIEKGSLLGKGNEKITCLNCLEPRYPKLALKRGYEGIIKVNILIKRDGTVKDVKIIKSSGYKILDDSALRAALQSRFYPISKETLFYIDYDMKLNIR